LLYLPPRPRRALIRTAGIVLALVGAVVFFVYVLPLLVAVGIGVFLSLVFFLVFAFVVGPHLTKTFVQITCDRLVLKTVDYGRAEVQKYNLTEKSHARQHLVRNRKEGSWVQGIDVTSKRGTAHFGDVLSPGGTGLG